jgi:hypothetical protein
MDSTRNRKERTAARSEDETSKAPQSKLLELQTEIWKARAQAKQKWLERILSEPVNGPRAAARRALWIRHALEAVRRGQTEIKYRAALNDACTEHLNVLEMILIGAAEQRSAKTESSAQTKDLATTR